MSNLRSPEAQRERTPGKLPVVRGPDRIQGGLDDRCWFVPFCRSAIARTDRTLEDLGKVAEIADSESPLRLGLKGEFNGARFELTGRAQMRHELGGYWDEWYATFSNGWVGWLAEDAGEILSNVLSTASITSSTYVG